MYAKQYKTKARFMKNVKITETCWLWTASLAGGGYGRIRISGLFVPAHRVAYELFVGPIEFGMQINHKCDVRHCVNPEHLYQGTQSQNRYDVREHATRRLGGTA